MEVTKPMSELFELKKLKSKIRGEFYFDNLHRMIYATDASVYREIPLGVAYPASREDLQHLVAFAIKKGVSLIPRTAGTSLAGQCVGDGIVVDMSRHFTKTLDFRPEEMTVKVEPGVIRDELNMEVASSGLFFGPNTSTSNRCMLGGMTANNSSGSTSIKYGVTRDKVLEVEMILSDGSEVSFREISAEELEQKLLQEDREGEIYRFFMNALGSEHNREAIRKVYPKPDIHRRNTGYALDVLCSMKPFTPDGPDLNLAKLISGSEGTLGLITSITLQLDPLPPEHRYMIAAHFNSIEDCCNAVVPLMKHDLYACEMMDKVILDCTKNNKAQTENRFFLKEDPQAILLLEVCDDELEGLEQQLKRLMSCLETQTGSYAHPVLKGQEIERAFELRKAGLGLLGNMIGDAKAVACIEDTAVSIEDLSEYIREFEGLMKAYGQKAVYYAHAGAGELHLRPILNLKESSGVVQFREITTAVAELVKKYRGAMSGEHGEGRVRSEFIGMLIGTENVELLRALKLAFDPEQIFNPGKIVNPVKMDEHLRYEPDRKEPEIETFMDFSDDQGLLRAVEKCNGSGDCRKTEKSNSTMCPSYHVTRQEKDTTRARANVLREVLTNPEKKDLFDSHALKEVLDLCLSCKACGSECPSNVDMASYKAEFLHQYRRTHGAPLRDKIFAYNGRLNKLGAMLPGIANNPLTRRILSKIAGIAPQRNLPDIKTINLQNVLEQRIQPERHYHRLILYIDEFTQYLDSHIAKDAIELLVELGYHPILLFGDSGRTYISKGFLPQARNCIDTLLKQIEAIGNNSLPIVGIEPSAILGFRDDFIKLASDRELAERVALRSRTVEEFLADLANRGMIRSEQFVADAKRVRYHAHCHQKALSDIGSTFTILNLPQNYTVTMINSGCCGMAGSFGYEKEHYEVSMKIGEQRLFPAIRSSGNDDILAANGNSCRHQIFDGTKRIAMHPVSVLRRALL